MTLLAILFAGFVGTILMSMTMGLIHRTGWANADMIRAVGSLVSRRMEGAFAAGVGLHLAAGLVFAFPYTFILGRLAQAGPLMTLGLGALMGAAHGVVMAIALVTVGSAHHPVTRFRDAGFEVGLAHVVGHVAYGVGVALCVSVLGITWGWAP
jgi:uncharacterized membrane protein YagU involved in acid resistance